MRRANAVPGMLADYSIIAGLSASGMMLVIGLIYLTTALRQVDLLL